MSDNKMVCGLAVEDIKPELMQEAMDVLLKMYQDGALKPHIDTVFAFEEVYVACGFMMIVTLKAILVTCLLFLLWPMDININQ